MSTNYTIKSIGNVTITDQRELQVQHMCLFENEELIKSLLIGDKKSYKPDDDFENLNHVIIKYSGNICDLDIWGPTFIQCLYKSENWHSLVDCHKFLNNLLFNVKKIVEDDCKGLIKIIKTDKIPDYTPIIFHKKIAKIHSAFHVQNGIFISKIGLKSTYLVNSLDELNNMYPNCDMYIKFI